MIIYGLNEVDLRIDNFKFEVLYQGRQIGGNTTSFKKPDLPTRSNTHHVHSQKRVPDGWADIKRAKDGLKIDDVPDPYANGNEEKKEKAMTLEEVGRSKKSATIVQKPKNKEFFEDEDEEFDWGDKNVSQLETKKLLILVYDLTI